MSSQSKNSLLSPFQKKKAKQTSSGVLPDVPIGLSDPQYATRKRSMFDFLSKMHALGCVALPSFFATGHNSVLESTLMWIFRLLWQLAGRAPENPHLLRPFLGLHSRAPAVHALGESPRSDQVLPSYCKESRCPTECQLKYSNTQWMCSVWLQLNTANGSPLPNPQKIPFGEPITEKSEVTERVRRAQRAILSPSTSPDIFLSGADPATECSFSENRIVLHISGPDVDDLNFIDLPGSFLNTHPLFFNILPRSLCWR